MSPVTKCPESLYTTGSRYTCTMFGRLLLRNWATANGHGGSPSLIVGSLSYVCRLVVALVHVAGGLLSCLHRRVEQWGLLCGDFAGADLRNP